AFGPQSVALGNDQLLIGWMDPREGGFDTDNQDIYLSKVDLNAQGPAPQTNIDKPDPVSLSVALSSFTYEGGGESLLASTFATRSGTKVVIVNKDDVAGALAGGVLARANLGPVLLSSAGGLSDSVKSEISRLNPAGAFVVGDTGQLSDQVTGDLVAAGVDKDQVTRVSGSGQAETAAQIASKFDRRLDAEKTAGSPAFDAAVIANPNSPDAGAAAGLAAARRLPILYVSKDTLPGATDSALKSLKIDKTLVIGGPQQISDSVMGQLPSPTRLGGADQYETSRAVAAESGARGLPSNVVYVADGNRPMDAALLGAAVGRLTGIMVLSPAPLFQTAADTASAARLSGIDRFVVVGPAPGQPPGGTPTTTPTATPTATSTPSTHRKRPKLSATVRPKVDRKAPYRFTTRGTLKRPSGVSRSRGCKGSVRVTVKRKGHGKTLSSRRVKVRSSCKFTSKVTFKSRKRFGKGSKGTLRFTIRFQGNARLSPKSITHTARYTR
ncbi:MAG: cell wall-binding repeat-containing protein, partial [Solirubrobacteraceae bacterium]